MTYFYTLRFDNEPEALAAAESLALLPDDEAEELPPTIVVSQYGGRLFGQAIVITDVQVPGTYDADGEELTPPVPVPGVFVNVCLNRNVLPSALRERIVPYGSGGNVFSGTEPEPGAWPPKRTSLT